MNRCRWCNEEIRLCTQENHNCRNGMVHASDLTHECGYLQYLARVYGIVNTLRELGDVRA